MGRGVRYALLRMLSNIMKNLLSFLFVLCTIGMQGQVLSNLDFEDAQDSKETPSVLPSNELNVSDTKSHKKGRSSAIVSKMLERANSYYDKMWYAEAAELYDEALKKDANSATPHILQRAGDSHYFNSEMEKAFFWYSKLFDLFKDDLTDSDYFRYAHILKGTGRYRKAKRLLDVFKSRAKGTATTAQTGTKNIKTALFEDNVEITNLNINSKYSEFSPMYMNGNELIFASSADTGIFKTKKYKWNNQPFLDLYVGQVAERPNELKSVKKFSKNINSKYHEAGVAMSPDNKTIYFTRTNVKKRRKRKKNNVGQLKIYRSQLVDGEWTEAEELPFNGDKFSTGHPALSTDGKKLYFASDRPGSLGDTDIYVVDVLEDGTYSEPKNLGRGVNSNHREMFPYIAGEKLFFSSDRRQGFGGLDIYEAVGAENTFRAPVNLGKPVNSGRDDFSYITQDAGETGYFASNRKGGKGDDDIYSFKVLPEEKVAEEARTAIVGTVTELVTSIAVPETTVRLLDENQEVLQEVVADADGSFKFNDLPLNSKFTITTENADYFTDTQEIATTDSPELNVAVGLKKLDDLIVLEEGVKKLKTDMIYFDFDRSYIRNDAKEELDKLVEVWEKYPNMVIKIESHTDSRGAAAYNRTLSDKRAKETKAYLLSKGIDESRIYSAIGYGEQYSLNDCTSGCSRETHQKNRRSEFIIVSM